MSSDGVADSGGMGTTATGGFSSGMGIGSMSGRTGPRLGADGESAPPPRGRPGTLTPGPPPGPPRLPGGAYRWAKRSFPDASSLEVLNGHDRTVCGLRTQIRENRQRPHAIAVVRMSAPRSFYARFILTYIAH